MMRRREFLTHTLAAGSIFSNITHPITSFSNIPHQENPKFSLFTKAWKMPLTQLAVFVTDLGFDGIELLVRPGYQVEPDRISQDLPVAVRVLSEHGKRIFSIAGPTDERTIAACGEQSIPLIRIMVEIPPGMRYQEVLDETRRRFDLLIPSLEKYRVKVGVQNHSGRFVSNSSELMRLLCDYDVRDFCAVWDPGHEALCGTEPDLALDMVESHLAMVNLKNAVKRQKQVSGQGVIEWENWWTTGKEGYANWPRIAEELIKRKWKGIVCLCAEYSEKEATGQFITEDLAFARILFRQI